MIRALLILLSVSTSSARAAIAIDPDFWEHYEPYQQYSEQMLRDLAALQEGDLLESARGIDTLELRVVGRNSTFSKLVSARVVVDSSAGLRIQVKAIPFEARADGSQPVETYRSQVAPAQAETLLTLLEDSGFWDAPYQLEASGRAIQPSAACAEAGEWIVEAYKPSAYQLISRTTCRTLDPVVAEIRDFLLALAGASAE